VARRFSHTWRVLSLLRSERWFGKADGRESYPHRVFMNKDGWPQDEFEGKPVIGICNSWSELTPCNLHFRRLAESVKRGVLESGGLPVEFPTISLGETLMRPTAMMHRNLMSIDVEESLRANPVDAVVLLAGCDKTTPAQLMGAASVDLPTLLVSGGPMLNAHYHGETLGSGTALWAGLAEVKAGRMTPQQFNELESALWPSYGHCMTMGTASTMASMSEALGVTLPGNAAIPAVDSRRYAIAQLAGRRIVQMVHEDLILSKILTRKAFENAIRVNAAIGGSTNAVVHLLAIAGRVGIPLTIDDFDKLGHDMPLLVNLKPSGQFLMEEFFQAGGVPAVQREIAELLHTDALTVNGHTVGENIKDAECWNRDVIRTRINPVKEHAGIAVLRGNLAPAGAIIKPSAATPELMKSRTRAVVFENIEDYQDRVDDPNLDIDEHCAMVLKNAGPRGFPGMPEVGNMTLPAKLAERGIRDMVRISDARMSGTAYGTAILHTAPESAIGGPLALVQNGDMIELDVEARRIHLDVSDAELEARKRAWKPAPIPFASGYSRLYVDHVLQADKGVDFDFLVGPRGPAPAR